MKPLAVYVHVPFCARHCAYCDFNVHVETAQNTIVRATVDATCADVRHSARELRETYRVETVFFGGGTPTFLTAEQLGQILQTIRDEFNVAHDVEISSEANPGSSDAALFARMRDMSFHRLSIGVQAFDNALLLAMDRIHSADDAERAVRAAQSAGFDNLSLDLMFGLPGQTLTHWDATLDRALALNLPHLSLYALTLEPGTRFERLHAGGKLRLPDEDTEAEMYLHCIRRLTQAGYAHYEVSNFAKPGYRCRHNLTYWRNGEYLGVGAGAVSYINGRRFRRERLPRRYVEKVQHGVDLTVESEQLTPEETLGETIMLGLRLREGISLRGLEARFGIDAGQKFAPQIARLTAQGWLELLGDTLRVTDSGLLYVNSIAAEFL
jgi:oxygen-independent coproporphyrinogen III oxidase